MVHNITPIKIVHSLDQCAIILNLDKNISPKAINAIAGIEFCEFQELKKDEKERSGKNLFFDFYDEKIKGDGNPAWKIRFGQNRIAICCYNYTRWERFYSIARNTLCEVAQSIQKYKIKEISLGVLDKFKVTHDGDFPLISLFRHDSNLIVPAFLHVNIPPAYSICTFSKVLDSVNPWQFYNNQLALTAEGEKQGSLLFSINNYQSMMGCEPCFSVDEASELISAIDTAAYFLHEQNKSILKQILTDPILTSIGLL